MQPSLNDLRTTRVRFGADKSLGYYHRTKRAKFAFYFTQLFVLVVFVSGCASNLQPAMLIDRIKNRGPINVSASNPYLVANQYLEFQRKQSVDIRQFLSSRGSPAALEIQKPLFEEALIYLYYPENGEYFVLSEGEEHWKILGPSKLSGRKMYQVQDVVKGIPAAR